MSSSQLSWFERHLAISILAVTLALVLPGIRACHQSTKLPQSSHVERVETMVVKKVKIHKRQCHD